MTERHSPRILRELEGLILYSLTGVAVTVSLLVYGATKSRNPVGLFDDWRPIFGVSFGLGLLAVTISLMAINRRWLGVGGVIAAYGLTFLLGLSPTREVPLRFDEFLAIGNTLTLLLLSTCHHQGLWDP